MNQKGFASVILIVAVVALLGAAGYFVFVKKSEPTTQQTPVSNQTNPVSPASSLTEDKTPGWRSHSNSEIGFSFKYPQTWKVEDNLKIDTCCLDLFNLANPYQGDLLKRNTMKAQFQYRAYQNVKGLDEFVQEDNRINGSPEAGIPSTIDADSLVEVPNDNHVTVSRFSGGTSGRVYIVPLNQNYTSVIKILVWNPDPTFGKVLSTFKLVK